MKTKLQIALILGAAFIVGGVKAENICKPVESRGEGHWPIPESEFTLENAVARLEKLQLRLNESTIGIEDFESLHHNTFIFFEGFMRKKLIWEMEQKNNTGLAHLAKKQFCDFLREKAYLSH